MKVKGFKSIAYIVLLLALSVVVSLVAGGCSKSSSNEIKIGVAGAMTGDNAIWGTSELKAAQLAVDEVNAKGGVLNKKIVLVPEDDQCDAKQAASVAQMFVSNKDIVGVIGHLFSGAALAAAPIYQQNSMPYIAVTASNPKIPQVGDYIFQINVNDNVASAQTADYTVSKLGAKNIAIIYDNSDYGKAFKDGFAAEAQKLGAQITDVETYVGGQDQDFSVQLTKIATKHPDTVLLAGYAKEAGLIVQQAKQLGVKVQFVGEDGDNDPLFLKLGGTAAEGTIVTTYFDRSVQDPVAKAFVEKYEKTYNTEAFSDTPYAYDAMNTMVDAIRRAGSTDKKAIRDAIASTNGLQGVSGSISFDHGARPVAWNIVLQVVNGKFQYKDLIH